MSNNLSISIEELSMAVEPLSEACDELVSELRVQKRLKAWHRFFVKLRNFLYSLFGYADFSPGGPIGYRIFLNGKEIDWVTWVVARKGLKPGSGFLEEAIRDKDGGPLTTSESVITRWRIGWIRMEARDG